jgi:SAM-dependent methyltransferase
MSTARPPQYGAAYDYTAHRPGVESVARSAAVVVPLLWSLFRPQRVLDLGCGAGDWLSEFLANGTPHVVGYDGDWVPQESLKILPDCFRRVDFATALPAPERFDLAMSLEVAEHVPADVALRLVDHLCASADLVLWSAAIPGQGGYEHVNERYQQYWVEVFAQRRFEAFDLVRPRVWLDDRVSWWYQQNCLVFANDAARQRYALAPAAFIPSLVHPHLYERFRDPRNYSVPGIVRCLPHYLRRLLGRLRPRRR